MTVPSTPTPAPAPNAAPPVPPPRQPDPSSYEPLPPHPKRRPGGLPVWAWVVLGIVGGLLTMGVGLLVLGLAVNAALPNDLVHEDFTVDGGAFATGEYRGNTFEVRDGAYVITNPPTADGPAYVFASLARPAAALGARVDVSAPPGTFVGLGCAARRGVDAYFLIVDPGGSAASLARFGDTDGSGLQELDTVEGLNLGTVQSIGLTCVNDPFADVARLTGYVNGQQVVYAETGKGVEQFLTVVLSYASGGSEGAAEFDNVDVVVGLDPGSEASPS